MSLRTGVTTKGNAMPAKNRYISSQDTREQVTREKLLDAAIELVNRHGMRFLTIRNICDEAGISTGSFYNLFDGKDDLVAYYLSNVFETYKQKAEEQAQGKTSLERIILIYRYYIECVLETGVEFITGLYSSITNPVFNFIQRDPDKEIVLDRVKEDLRAGIEKNEIKASLDIDEALLHIATIITGNIYYWCVFEGKIDLAYQTDVLLQDYLRTISTTENEQFNIASIKRQENALI